MDSEQMSFVLSSNSAAGNTRGIFELNELLKDGWKVLSTCEMSGAGQAYYSYALVILEKPIIKKGE